MKFLKGLLIFFVFLYLVVLVVLFFYQERLLFLADKIDANHTYRTGQEVEIEVDNGVFMNCLMMKISNSKGAILYLHGNKGSIRRCIRQAEMIEGNGYDIFMPDYRGYGKSDGKISSEKQLLGDVQKAYDYLKKRYDENKIVIVGYSLGSGMASYLATQNNPQQIALIAPYVSLPDVKNQFLWFTPDFLMKYHLKTENYIKDIRCPITLFHGTNDELIPYNSSERLLLLKPEQVELITLNGTSHRGAIFDSRFRQKMRLLLK